MLQIFIIYILTILISLGFQVSMALDTIKYIADNNYKINIHNLKKIDLDKNSALRVKATILLPLFLNIITQFKYLNDYINNKYLLLDELRVFDALEKMTIEEIKDYENNPTLLNALTITMNQNTNEIATIRYEGKLNTVVYNINKETKELEIKKIIGNLKNKDNDEQRKILKEYLENKDDLENIDKELKDIINDIKKINNTFENNEKKLDDIDRKLDYLKTQKEKLESYMNELNSNRNNDKKDIKTLSKKKNNY